MNTEQNIINTVSSFSFHTFENPPLNMIVKKINKFLGKVIASDHQKMLITIFIVEGIIK